LPLLEQCEHVLLNPDRTTKLERNSLATQLERWRYQILNRNAGKLASDDAPLADAIDLASNQVAGRPSRPARATRAAISNSAYDVALADAMQCLDLGRPLTEVVAQATRLTREQLGQAGGNATAAGWPVLLYVPLYLSNYCINHCTYCGFRHPNAIPREHLSVAHALREAAILRQRGFKHILLVAGDFPRLTTTEYFVEILASMRAQGDIPSIEIASQSTASYAAMADAGNYGFTLFQETYLEELYARYHPRGSKVSFDWRLESFDRAAEAGMQRLGLGFLLGLGDPRKELLAMMRHALYLQSRFPHCTFAFNLPRIHEAPDGFVPPYPVDDELFMRMYCALRTAFPSSTLVLSTRELPAMRDRLARVCITQMSAGSCTAPGGYEASEPSDHAGKQFPVCDERSVAQVIAALKAAGASPMWQ
jgi:2-iminoacetate synthase